MAVVSQPYDTTQFHVFSEYYSSVYTERLRITAFE